MRYRTEAQKRAIIDFLTRHGFTYRYTLKNGVEVYENENRYPVNVKADH